MLAMVRAHWGLGSRVLAEMFLPNGSPADRSDFAEWQRESATPETAAELLQLVYESDVSQLVSELAMPVQVMHRRGDRAVSFRLGRELAAAIPGARFVQLEGDFHAP